MLNISDFHRRDVIDSVTAEKLGYVCDLEIDLESGRIKSIIVPKKYNLFPFLFKKNEYVIPWENIEAIGKDIILVKTSLFNPPKKTNDL